MKKYTFRDLKKFVNELNEEQLDYEVVVHRGENNPFRAIAITWPEDEYIYDEDHEDYGTLEELKEREGFDEDRIRLTIKKGQPMMFDFWPDKTL